MSLWKNWLDSLSRAARQCVAGASRAHRCVVLIDADNVPPRIAEALQHFAASLGRIETIELFENFSKGNAPGWATQMRALGITGIQHYRTSITKNSSDAALVVRAMDLLHTSRPHHYVLVSTDSDFAPLAHRIRKSGAQVHGVGDSHAPSALRQSCTSFMTFAELSDRSGRLSPELWKGRPEDAEDRLLALLAELGGAHRWISTTALGGKLKTDWPLFDARAFSCRNLTELCSMLDSIDVDRSGSQARVKLALRR